MTRPLADILAGLAMLRPAGDLFPAGDPDGYDAAHDTATALEIQRIEAAMELLLAETDPRDAGDLLPDYERVLGPDPCGRDQLDLDTGAQRTLAWQRWTAAPSVCAGYFVAAGAAIGVPLTIQEFPLDRCGAFVCGAGAPVPSPAHLQFVVSLPAARSWDAICGATVCGETMGGFTPNLMECVIRNEAPLHTVPVFSYVG